MKNLHVQTYGIHEFANIFVNFSHQPSLMKPAMVQVYAWLAELSAWVPAHKNIAEHAWHLNRHLNHAWHTGVHEQNHGTNTRVQYGV